MTLWAWDDKTSGEYRVSWVVFAALQPRCNMNTWEYIQSTGGFWWHVFQLILLLHNVTIVIKNIHMKRKKKKEKNCTTSSPGREKWGTNRDNTKAIISLVNNMQKSGEEKNIWHSIVWLVTLSGRYWRSGTSFFWKKNIFFKVKDLLNRNKQINQTAYSCV